MTIRKADFLEYHAWHPFLRNVRLMANSFDLLAMRMLQNFVSRQPSERCWSFRVLRLILLGTANADKEFGYRRCVNRRLRWTLIGTATH